MADFTVNYRMVCNGTVVVRAASLEEARKTVENTALSLLGKEADDGEVEIVSVLEDGVGP